MSIHIICIQYALMIKIYFPNLCVADDKHKFSVLYQYIFRTCNYDVLHNTRYSISSSSF